MVILLYFFGAALLLWLLSFLVMDSYKDVPLGTGEVGLVGLPWHAMGLEMELQPKPDSGVVSLQQAADRIRAALKLAEGSCTNCSARRQAALQRLDVSFFEQIKWWEPSQWTMHRESDPGNPFELVSPWLRNEEEAELSLEATRMLASDFAGGRFAASHVHVDGRCLLTKSGIGVISLLLLWESFHEAIVQICAKRDAHRTYGPKLADKHPELLAELQKLWLAEEAGHVVSSASELAKLFERHFDSMFKMPRLASFNVLPERDGYRNFAVNVCHLLDIRCCRKCNKNQAPKHGLVEFRVFDVAYGTNLKAIYQLVQRTVQRVCQAYPSGIATAEALAARARLRPLLHLHAHKPRKLAKLTALLDLKFSTWRAQLRSDMDSLAQEL